MTSNREEIEIRMKFIKHLLGTVEDPSYPEVNQLAQLDSICKKDFHLDSKRSKKLISLAIANMTKGFSTGEFSNYIGNVHVGTIAKDIYNIVVKMHKNFILIE